MVPSGAVSLDRKHWLSTSETFFLPVQALSILFRAKFRAAIDQAGLLDLIPSEVWQQPWVVHCQPVGDGTRALEYLARYVFRVAIANSRILSSQDGMVVFSYRDKKTGLAPRAAESHRVHPPFPGSSAPQRVSKGPPLRLLQPHLRPLDRSHPFAGCSNHRPPHAAGSVRC